MFLQMMINLEEQVVILDEAHNIEDASREAASFKFNDADLEAAVIDLNTALDSEGLELPENFRHGRDLVTLPSFRSRTFVRVVRYVVFVRFSCS